MGSPEKKIVLDLRPLQTSYAQRGIGRYTAELVKELIKQHTCLHSLVFKNLTNPFPQLPVLIRAPLLEKQWLWDQLALPFLLWINRVRLLHNFTALGPLPQISFPGLFAHRTIATIHDLHMFEKHASQINQFYRRTKRIRIQEKSVPRLFRCAVDSALTAKKVLERFPISPSQVLEVPVGGDHLKKIKTHDSTNGQAELPKDFILSLGDTENKNLSLSFKILSRLRIGQPSLHWVICGRKDRASIHPEKRSEAFPWIKFFHDVDDGLLALLYKKSRLLLFPSTEEGFGIPVAEAMHLKCPVIASGIEPLNSILGYDTGLDPRDHSDPSVNRWTEAVQAVLQKGEARHAMIENHHKQVQYYRWQTAADKISKVYREVGQDIPKVTGLTTDSFF